MPIIPINITILATTMKIQTATKSQTPIISQLIMTAMTDDCCQYFAGEHHTLADFRSMMTSLVEREDSQYSYLNTLVAIDDDGDVMGAIVGYDGGKLHELRQAFINAAKECFGRDFSRMDDETQAGEVYLDSLAVMPDHRGKGIATSLLRAMIEKAAKEGHPAVGLLVDKGNPNAERLYLHVGFEYANDSSWGGHPMRHLVYRID